MTQRIRISAEKIARPVPCAAAVGLALMIVISCTGLVAQDGSVAIQGAKIVTQPGTVIEKGTVVVRDGLIEAVGQDVEVPFDARVIDGEGLVVYAGFIDAGTSKGLPTEEEGGRVSGSGADRRDLDLNTDFTASMQQVNRNGIFPDYSSSRFVQISEEDAQNWRLAGFTAVHVMPGNALLNGTSTLVALTDSRSTPIRDSILHNDFAAVAGWRASGNGYPSSTMGSVAHLRQTFLDAQHYQAQWDVYRRAQGGTARPPHDSALEAVGQMLRGQVPVIFPASDVDDLYRATTLTDEFGLQMMLDGMQQGFQVVDLLQQLKVPVILRINFPSKPELGQAVGGRFGRGFGGRRGGPPDDENREVDRRVPVAKGIFEDRLARWEQEVGNPASLAAAGIEFVFSTNGNENPDKFLEQLRLAMEHGLDPDDALNALTARPAAWFGLENELGSIAPGKMAHLVVMTGPLQNKDSEVKYSIVNGVVFEPAEDSAEVSTRRGQPGAESSAGRGRRGRGGARGQGQDVAQAEQQPDEAGQQQSENEEGKDQADAEVQLADWPIETDDSRKPARQTGGNLLIRGATLITASTGTLENTDLLIRQGVIEQIGRELAAPEGFTVIDGQGAWVMPGIIDCHSHMVAGGNEGTLSVTSEVRASDNIRSSDLTVYRAAAGGVTAANVLHGSANTIGGQRIVIQMKYRARPEQLLFPGFVPGIKFALGENVIRSETRYPHTRMGVESVIRLALEAARRYDDAWQNYNSLSDDEKAKTVPPRRDLRLEALVEVLHNQRLVHCHCYNAGEILMLLHTFTRYGIENLTLEHGMEAYKVAPELIQFGKNGAYVSTFADFWGYKVEAYDAIPYNCALINDAGGVAILNSDSGERVRRLYLDAAKMVRWGEMSYQDAIRTITLNPAIALHLDDVVGSIEVGKKADLALFNGHPLNTFSRPFMTLIDGEVVFEREGPRGGPFPLEEKPGVPASLPAINADGVYAISNASIYPVTGPPIPRGTLVIQNGQIAAVGPNVSVPQGATVVDGSNLHVYPGLVDGGSTVAVSDLGLTDANEQGDLQPDLWAASALKPDSPLIGIARFTGITSTVTTPTGGIVSGQSAAVQLDGWNFDELAFVPQLALEMSLPSKEIQDPNQRRGGRGRGPQPQPDPDEEVQERPKPLLTPRQQVLKLFADARQYDRVRQEAQQRGARPLKFDAKLDAMLPYVRKERPVVVRVRSATDILDAIEFAKEIDANVILRDSGSESWKVADKLKEAGIPILIGSVTQSPSSNYDPYDTVYSLPARLHEAGVLFAFHSSDNTHARDLPLWPGIAVGFGLPEQAAIESVTINPARIFGIDNLVGSLEVGKRADIIVTDRSPLQATSNVIHMFIGGKPVDVNDNLHTELYEKYQQRLGSGKQGEGAPGSGS